MKKITAYRLCNIEDSDYCRWCSDNHLNKKHMSTKKLFFFNILTGRLVRNSRTGKLEKRRVNRKMKLEW